MKLDKPIQRAPVDELAVDSLLLNFAGQYAVLTVRALADGEQVGEPTAFTVHDHGSDVVRVADDSVRPRIERREVVKGGFSALSAATSAEEVDTLAKGLGIFPGREADAKDAEQAAEIKAKQDAAEAAAQAATLAEAEAEKARQAAAVAAAEASSKRVTLRKS